MTGKHPLDDEFFDALLAGRATPPDAAPLAAFAQAVRATAARPGRPSAALAAMMPTGVFTEKGDPSARAASNATGPAPQASGLPKWRSKMAVPQILAMALGKIAGASGVAQAATGVTIAMVSVTGAGAAGVLPPPVQDRVAAVAESLSPFDLPDSTGKAEPVPAPGGDEQEQEQEQEQEGEQEGEQPTKPDQASFGTSVSEDARDGGVDGALISEQAKQQGKQQGRAPATAPAATAERTAPASRPTSTRTSPRTTAPKPERGVSSRPASGPKRAPDRADADGAASAQDHVTPPTRRR
jgi:hypothetical protein